MNISLRSLSLCVVTFLALAYAARVAHGQTEPAPAQVYITMHSAPIDDYCGPCITSEKMLKDAKLEYRKVLEPLGPWPWFKFTDAQGNQSTVRGGLLADDIELAKKGELPKNR
jgi:hypothetical protein